MTKTISNALKLVAVDLIKQEDGSYREKREYEKDHVSDAFDSQIYHDYVKAFSNLFNQNIK